MSNVLEIKKDIYYTGVLDKDLEVFDIIMETEFGTTYNSYLIKDEKTVLIDTVKSNFKDIFFEKIEAITPIENIDYIVAVSYTHLAVENHGIEEKKSAKTVKKIDKERTSFYNFYTNMKWADARDFDLCINTSKITIDEAVEIILETVKRHYKDEIK